MIVLVARYLVKPGREMEVEEALIDMADMVETYEPDCLMYQVSRSTENAREFLIYEQYVDESAVEFHRETAHFKNQIVDRVIPLLEKREVVTFESIVG